ncbi:MAG: class I SAM-dependent methyltransferase [Lysobacteraceae bacterium]
MEADMVSWDRHLDARDRFELWISVMTALSVRRVAEIGVYRGQFSARMLAAVPSLQRYFLIDPWRQLSNWNKPANTDDMAFEGHYRHALNTTEFAAEKRTVLRGLTSEVVDEIPDSSLDLVYIDGDHTLRGISIDLISSFPKVRDGGWIVGDDLSRTIWQHDRRFEPTMVFPFVVHFAEAHRLRIFTLPFNQFAMQKTSEAFELVDLAGGYGDTSLHSQLL